MQHIDEHTLELYALSDPLLAVEREQIEEHLLECEGCSRLLLHMRQFHEGLAAQLDDVRQRLLSEERTHIGRTSATITKSDSLPVERFDGHIRWPSRSKNRMPSLLFGPIGRLVRLHPFLAGMSSMGIIVVAALAIVLFQKASNGGPPAYVHYNNATNSLDVFGKGNGLLWSLPSQGVHDLEIIDRASGTSHNVLCDINNDGQPELITIIPSPIDDLHLADALRVYSANGTILSTTHFSHHIPFGDISYPSSTQLLCVYAEAFSNSREKRIVVVGTTGRSPATIGVTNGNGEIVGEYWHFGNFPLTRKFINPDSHQVLLALAGSNDLEDDKNGAYPILVILNPGSIEGRTESKSTPGFGYTPSKAEVVYIRLPVSDFERKMQLKCAIAGLEVRETGSDNVIQIVTGDPTTSSTRPMFEYTFDLTFRLISVKTGDQTRQLYHRQSQTDSTVREINDAYLRNLGSQVRYWNGTDWDPEPARVISKDKRDSKGSPVL